MTDHPRVKCDIARMYCDVTCVSSVIAERGAPERTRTPTAGLYNFARTDVVCADGLAGVA